MNVHSSQFLASGSAGVAGHLLGSISSAGAALAVTVLLIVGIRGRGRIRLSHDSAVIIGFVAGLLYSAAGGVWGAPGKVSQGVAAAAQQGFGNGGSVGLGAIALGLALVAYGTRLKPFPAAVLGILAAPIFAAAGGLWGIATTVLSSGLNQVLG